MTFKFTFRVDPVGMTVPYAAIADDIRNNSGFEDLRGRPAKASAIAEGNASLALRRLLVRIANVGSTIFTLGACPRVSCRTSGIRAITSVSAI